MRHAIIADCTKLKVWQLRDLIWHNVDTDVQEHGKGETGTHLQPLTDTPIEPHAHANTKRTPHVRKTFVFEF
jgi:hypothetical protein